MDSKEGTPAGPEKRSRTSQACQHCRSLKARCLASGEKGTCQRCLSSKRECIWTESQPRPKRVRTTNSRTAQMEQKIDGLVALLVQPETSRAPPVIDDDLHGTQSPVLRGEPRNVLSSSASSTPDIQEQGQGAGSPFQHDPNVSQSSFTHQESYIQDTYRPEQHETPAANDNIPHDAVVFENASEHALAKDIVSPAQAHLFLSEFRKMADFFPFVIVPPDLTVQAMEIERPMLLLAVFMTASGDDRFLQIALEERFRRELAAKTIINAQRSMDCLQSILVYLAWYHYHFKPQAQQIYQLLHLVVSMSADLAISHKSKRPAIQILSNGQAKSKSPSEQREAHRAFLGCYYLSTGFSSALDRPNVLKYSDYMTDCCKRLQSDREFPSDNIIPDMISLHHIGDQIYAAFKSEDTDNLDVDQVRLRMHVQVLQSQLKDWRRGIVQDTSQQTAMDLSYEFNRMELHSVGTRLSPPSPGKAPAPITSANNTYQFDLLLSCLEAGKAYLDTVLAVPRAQYRLFSFIEWMRLPNVLLMISTLSFPSARYSNTTWDVLIAQERVRLELYLESLCYRMQSLTTCNGTTQPQPDIFLSLKLILERTRAWYSRKTHTHQEENRESEAVEDSPLEIIRDPHERDEAGSSAASAQYKSPEETGSVMHHATAAANESPSGPPAAFPDMADFADMDGFLDNIDDTFWTSNLFDAAMF